MIHAPPPAPFARSWQGLYAACYAIFEAGVHVFLGALLRARRVSPRTSVPAGGFLVCPNHEGYLDPALVQQALRRRLTFVMTNEFYRLKSSQWFYKLVGAMPVAPGRMAFTTMRRAAALLRLGNAVVVFPEGRLSEGGTLHAFQRGVAMIVRRARVPVVPVAIAGSRGAWGKGARWLRRSHVRIAVGETLRREDASREGDQAFADRMRAAVAALRESLPPARV